MINVTVTSNFGFTSGNATGSPMGQREKNGKHCQEKEELPGINPTSAQVPLSDVQIDKKEQSTMNRKTCLGILLGSLSLLPAHAQWTREDSLRLQRILNGEEELIINREAVNAIQWDVPSKKSSIGQPLLKDEKPWMEFRTDLPSDFTEKTRLQPLKYIRLLPYSIFTRWNENPVDDVLSKSKQDTLKRFTVHMKLFNLTPDPSRMNGHVIVPEGMDPTVSPSASPLLTGLDIDKLLYESLTKRGRAIRRNREKAKAWKTYQAYIPNTQDTTRKDTALLLQVLRELDPLPVSSDSPLRSPLSVPFLIQKDSVALPADSIPVRNDSLPIRNDSLLNRKDSLPVRNNTVTYFLKTK